LNWDLAYSLTTVVYMVWALAYLTRSALRINGCVVPAAVNLVFFEGRPFIPALVVFACLTGAVAIDAWAMQPVNLIGGLALWWIARHEKDDDDRWRRRRARAAGRITRVGARLQVVPVAGGVK